MRVLGLTTEGDSGAAVVDDGRILAAVNEERLSRLKLVEGFPRGSIAEVLGLSGTDPGELDAVLVGSTKDAYVDQLQPYRGWFEHWEHGGLGGRVKRQAARFSRYRRYAPFLESAYYVALAPTYWSRRRAIRRVLRREYGIRCPVHFVDHHFAHVTSAYYTSGFDDALVISVDGGGDGRSALVYAVRGGRFQFLSEDSAFNSLGNYYAYATHLCGFTPMKHEGKVTGLAAYGEPKYVDELRAMIDEREGRLHNRAGVVFSAAIREILRRLPRGWTREDLAASVQRHFEDVVRRYVGHWARRSGLRDLALAGGVFGNVRVNQEVHELPEVDRVFIHPHMGDGGLSVGAALAACAAGVLPRRMAPPPGPLPDVFLGPDLADHDVIKALVEAGLAPERPEGPIEERVADLLADGYVVARAAGRMEYGPRALGNRSVLYQPADRSVNDWLNRNLRRTEFMPFAPATLWEARSDCFEQVEGADHAAQFMTITFRCTPWAAARMPGVVHLDGTARPQLVRRETSPGYYRIIEAFRDRTGLPAVINTSFNMHEEPIVCGARDCVRGFLDGKLDWLAIGPFLVRHPNPFERKLHGVRRSEATAAAEQGGAGQRPQQQRVGPSA